MQELFLVFHSRIDQIEQHVGVSKKVPVVAADGPSSSSSKAPTRSSSNAMAGGSGAPYQSIPFVAIAYVILDSEKKSLRMPEKKFRYSK